MAAYLIHLSRGWSKHKAQFLQSLKRDCYENIWTEELRALELEEALAEKRKRKPLLTFS